MVVLVGEKERLLNLVDGQQLFVKCNFPLAPRAVIVVVHGLGGHQGRYDYLTNYFVRHDVAVYRYDHRGHGQTPGPLGEYGDFNHLPDDLHAVVTWAKQMTPHLPIFVIGHSLGGGTALAMGIKYPHLVNGFVTVGALTQYHDEIFGPIRQLPAQEVVSGDFGEQSNSSAWMRKDYLADPLNLQIIKGSLMNAAFDLVQFNRKYANKFNDPILMLHGQQDGIVSPVDSLKTYQVIKTADKELHVYPFLKHQVLNEPSRRDEVYAEILAWFKRHVQ